MNATTRAVLASLLLAAPVVAETTHLVASDGGGHVLFAGTQLAGWALVATVCRDLAAVPGSGRWGPRLVVGGVVAQGLFAAAYLATFLAAGEPSESAFVLFLAGFLALTVGGLVWARTLRRTPASGAAPAIAAVAVLGFLAMAVGVDPLHDLALVGSYLAWALVGRSVPVAAGRELSSLSDAWR